MDRSTQLYQQQTGLDVCLSVHVLAKRLLCKQGTKWNQLNIDKNQLITNQLNENQDAHTHIYQRWLALIFLMQKLYHFIDLHVAATWTPLIHTCMHLGIRWYRSRGAWAVQGTLGANTCTYAMYALIRIYSSMLHVCTHVRVHLQLATSSCTHTMYIYNYVHACVQCV